MPRPPHNRPRRRLVRAVQRIVRASHHAFMNRGLPAKVGLYLHTLAEDDYDGFRKMVTYFRKKGYRIATDPDDFQREKDERTVWISFDDCFHQWYRARFLFDELSIRATFFTNTSALRDEVPRDAIAEYLEESLGADPTLNTLTTEEVKTLHADGHTVGAHTHSHPVLTDLPFAEAVEEIRINKELLEELLGEPVYHFAYPYGLRRYFSPELMQACKEMGFHTIARAIPALQHAEQGPFVLHRSGWDCSKSVKENVALLSIDGSHFERLTGRSAVG